MIILLSFKNNFLTKNNDLLYKKLTFIVFSIGNSNLLKYEITTIQLKSNEII